MHVNTICAALDKKCAKQGLHEPEDRCLHDTVDFERFRPVNVSLDSACSTKFIEILAQGSDNADFGQGQRTQVDQNPASLLERCVNHLLESLDLGSCLVAVPIDQSTANLCAEHEVGERLGWAVMDLPRNSQALVFLGLDERQHAG